MRSPLPLAAACLAPAMSCALAAEEPALGFGAGAHFSRGDYGTSTTTEITSLQLTVRRETGPWLLKLVLPYLEVSGSTSVVPGVGNVGRGRRGGGGGTAARTTGTASGLGDVAASATYAFYYDAASRLALDATGKLKLPTADRDEGLGTGEADVSFQVDAYKAFDRVTAFGGVGYTVFGSSAEIELDDALNYTLGAIYRLDARDSAGITYDERERLSARTAERREVMAFVTRKLNRLWSAQLYFLVGSADGSPDWGTGASAMYAF